MARTSQAENVNYSSSFNLKNSMKGITEKHRSILALGIGLVILTALTSYAPILYFINLLSLFFLSIWCLFKIYEIKMILRYGTSSSYIFLLGIIVTALSLRVAETKFNWLYFLDVEIFRHEYDDCEKSGIAFEEVNRISVCKRNDLDRWGIVEAVVYDSSDQIALPPSKQSIGWRQAVTLLDKKAPFSDLGYTVSHIVGHFYLVQFSYNQKSNF